MWLLIQMISTGNCLGKSPIKPTKPTKPALPFTFHIISHFEFDFFRHLEISQSTVSISSGPRGRRRSWRRPRPRRQQHPADLHVAVARRREVQRGVAVAGFVGHGAGHRPLQVPDPAEVTAAGRLEDVVVASGGHGPPREGTGGRAEATTETPKIVTGRLELE